MKGLIYLVLMIVFVAIGCVAIPFVVMPGADIGVALPVIYVPGEHIESLKYLPGHTPVTNTMIAAWITIGVLVFWILPVVWLRKQVPGRAQGFIEMIVEYWMNLARTVAGEKGRQLVPLTLSIFFFVLVANMMKIVPGVDTIGELHCAGLVPHSVGEEEEFLTREYFENLDEEQLNEILEEAGVESVEDLTDEQIVEFGEHEYSRVSKENFIAFSGYKVQSLSGDSVVALKNSETLNTGENMTYEQYKDCKESLHAGDIFNDPPAEDAEDDAAEPEESEEEAPADDAGEGEEGSEEGETEGANNGIVLVANQSGGDSGANPAAEGEVKRKYGTDPANDYFAVTPFVRGATTDLSMTLAIALIAMVTVQYFSIKELGVGGWGVKFVNLPAIEAGGIKIIDFAVGLLEIVLEFAKVVSFAFRLFGAMFAGQILMFVIVFLAGTFVPVIVVLLEVFIGAIQAFVFAILFVMFSTVAMTSHHGDDHDHH